MKTLRNFTMAILGVVFAINIAAAQNYKAPMINSSGKILDKNGKNIGIVTKDGTMDEKGAKMSYIDAEGNLIDSKTGKKMGKAEKNGNFAYFFSETGDGKNFTVSAPANGTCEVKDDKGNVVLLIHENYKAQAACAYHCAQMKKEGKEMKMKDNHSNHTH